MVLCCTTENGIVLVRRRGLVHFSGNCYRSWEPGLNPNVSKVRTDQKDYFLNILRSGHGSVLEHANYSFVIWDCSRVFTHELTRHRAGSAFSQESLRFVRLKDIPFRIPDSLESMRPQIISILETLEDFQITAAEHFGLDEEGKSFHEKKEITSALRRLAPEGLSTMIVWTANVRTLRHTIQARTDPGAEEEIRLVSRPPSSCKSIPSRGRSCPASTSAPSRSRLTVLASRWASSWGPSFWCDAPGIEGGRRRTTFGTPS